MNEEEKKKKAGFRFPLGNTVTIKCSGEAGRVIGRAEYENSENSYFVRYRAGDGRAVETWWNESALIPATSAA